jgi:UDP-N-acetylmuramate dehydrogenase
MDIDSGIPLASRTTLKIGGKARSFAEPSTRDEVCEAIAWAKKSRLRVLALGRGSNVVISDRGWDGLVIYLSSHFGHIIWHGAVAEAEGGAALHTLVKESVQRGLQGMECLGWIPGSVGGAVVMNAGAFGQSMGDVATDAETVDCTTGATRTLSAAQLTLGYRTSALQNCGSSVLSVRCELKPSPDSAGLERRFKEIYQRRREKQPLDCPSCGSVFKNPPNQSAGILIEQCGLKGYAIGGVRISDKHANFFLTEGNASAEDFRKLTCHVQRAVYERFAVPLEPEVLFVGEFDTPLFTP